MLFKSHHLYCPTYSLSPSPSLSYTLIERFLIMKMKTLDSSGSKCISTKEAKRRAPSPEKEQLPCPRCDSTNTKFCYYNNYNYSQPRYFCKACRRYWTRGGTLRDIPVGGGGIRRSAKRPRTNSRSSSSSSSTGSSTNYEESRSLSWSATPVLMPSAANQGSIVQFCDVKGSESLNSLWNNRGQEASRILALGGFGLGLGHGFDEVGFGLGRGIWPFVGVGGDGTAVAMDGSGGNAAVRGSGYTWQYGSGGESATLMGGDCFAWPDLAISTAGFGLK